MVACGRAYPTRRPFSTNILLIAANLRNIDIYLDRRQSASIDDGTEERADDHKPEYQARRRAA